MPGPDRPASASAHEGYAAVENAKLYYREVGEGPPIIIVHGGPDFDHGYLLPDMDRLADGYRLIYYDQRGRGKTIGRPRPEELTVRRSVEDLEGLRRHLRLEPVAVLGHSWGARPAMEYAVRYPEHVSHLILLNPIYASRADRARVTEERARRLAPHRAELDALESSAAYGRGDPATVAAYYRIVYSVCIRRREDLDRLDLKLRTPEAILSGREVEDRLLDEMNFANSPDLLPRLRDLPVPTLVVHGDYDVIPPEVAAHIAETVPDGRFVLLPDCGHFSYLESPSEVRKAIDAFFKQTTGSRNR